jgi:hypothetical protein
MLIDRRATIDPNKVDERMPQVILEVFKASWVHFLESEKIDATGFVVLQILQGVSVRAVFLGPTGRRHSPGRQNGERP